jgi:lysophospholipase L1-like esterase
MHRTRELIVENFDNGAYHSNVYVSAAGLMLDRYYGYPLTTEVVGSRYTEIATEHGDEVHPRNEGYDQMADAMLPILSYLTHL